MRYRVDAPVAGLRGWISTAALLVGCLLAGTVAAAVQQYPAALKPFLSQGIRVVKQFAAVEGLKGWVVERDGNYRIVYTSADGKYLFIGLVADEQGNNLTQAEYKKYVPKPNLAGAWSKLERADWVAEGSEVPKAIVYVVFDPNCPYCHFFWRAAQAYEKVGLQVRYVLVAFVKPDSAGKAAAILESNDPARALNKNETGFQVSTETGAIAPMQNPKPATRAKLRANMRLMSSLRVESTPTIFYKSPSGEVRMVSGMPRLGRLPELFGLPKQKIDDPDLARFR